MTSAISGAGSSLLTQLLRGNAIQSSTRQSQAIQKHHQQKEDTVQISEAARSALKSQAPDGHRDHADDSH